MKFTAVNAYNNFVSLCQFFCQVKHVSINLLCTGNAGVRQQIADVTHQRAASVTCIPAMFIRILYQLVLCDMYTKIIENQLLRLDSTSIRVLLFKWINRISDNVRIVHMQLI